MMVNTEILLYLVKQKKTQETNYNKLKELKQ